MENNIKLDRLIIPVYINEKIVLDMLAIIEDGFSMVSQINYTEHKESSCLLYTSNILIAVASDFESAVRAGSLAGGWWLSSEGVWLYGGWWNVLNGLAGILNIFCMTGWWGIYSSKDKKDMLWPDMIWVYVLAYDIWNFQYTYLNLPTHSWYCGLALLLAPTFAAALWNKGGWIQNRANTLALWCMFAQVFPLFQDASRFTTVTYVYGQGGIAAAMGSSMPTIAEPTAQGIISVLSFAVNVFVFAYIRCV